MSWPPSGHDRQRELFGEDAPVPDHIQEGKTLPQQIEGDHAYRDDPPVDHFEERWSGYLDGFHALRNELDEDQAEILDESIEQIEAVIDGAVQRKRSDLHE